MGYLKWIAGLGLEFLVTAVAFAAMIASPTYLLPIGLGWLGSTILLIVSLAAE